MHRILMLILVCGIFASCGDKGSPPPTVLKGFENIPINGSQMELASKINHQGIVMERGPMLHGVKNGTWTEYHLDQQIPSNVTSYVNGVKTGPYMEFNEKGEMKLYADYFQDKLHGRRIEFGSIGRFKKEARYKDGVFHGIYTEWNMAGKMQKSMNYNEGKLDGAFTYYNQSGEKVLIYEYKNGEKISGGPVTPEAESTEEK